MKNLDPTFSLIKKEEQRQKTGIELIASENFVSSNVLKAMGSILTNKYAEGYPGKRYYGGCEIVDKIEQTAIDRAKELFGVEYANVQPHSGSQANAAVFMACLNPGDPILGLNISHGGHLTHGDKVNFSGKIYKNFSYEVEKESGLINYKQVEKIANTEKPKLIICGASAYCRDIDYKKFREIADQINAILLADISHPAGLIATKLLNDPKDHCHILTTTTHKTLRGPRGGMIMMGKDFENPFEIKNKKGKHKKMSELIDLALFPGIQGGPLEHIIAAKAVGFLENLQESYAIYTKQIIKNAKKLASCLVKKNYQLISGGTDNHCILIDLRNKELTGKEAEKILEKASITTNKNLIPFDEESPFITSGIRLGTAAITTRGLKENHMEIIAEFIDEVISNKENENKIQGIKNEVNQMMKNYPLFSEE